MEYSTVLKLLPGDLDAMRCKAIAGIQIGEDIEQVLGFIEGCSEEQKISLAAERAYCLYRLSRYSQVIEAVDSLAEPSLEAKMIKAQALYKMGDFKEAVNVFANILNSDPDEESLPEIQANYVAAHLGLIGFSTDQMNSSLNATGKESYELAFNLSCSILGDGSASYSAANANKARDLLDGARRMATELLEEDGVSESDIDKELQPIKVQEALLLARQGDIATAQQQLSNLRESKTLSDTSAAVVANNQAALGVNIALSTGKGLSSKAALRLLADLDSILGRSSHSSALLKPVLEEKLSWTTKASILTTLVCLLMSGGKKREALETVMHGASLYRGHLPLLLAKCAVLASDGKHGKSESILNKYCQKEEYHKGDKGQKVTIARLAQAQYALMGGGKDDKQRAVKALSMSPISLRPGILATCMQILDDCSSASKLDWLHNVVQEQHHSSETQAFLHREIGKELLARGEEDKAHVSLLKAANLGDNSALSILARLTAFNGGKTLPMISAPADETSISAQAASLDCDLLSSWVPEDGVENKKEKSSKGSTMVVDGEKRKRRRPRYPKNFNPDNPGPMPDPERWLPKYERAEYERKLKKKLKVKGGAAAIKGAQGGSKVNEELDASKTDKAQKKTSGPSLPKRTSKKK